MPFEEKTLTAFIATKTGMSEQLVDRIVDQGEPWPFVAAFPAFLKYPMPRQLRTGYFRTRLCRYPRIG